MAEPDDAERRRIVADAVLRFGRRLHTVLGELCEHLGDGGSAPIERLQSEVIDVIVDWLSGTRISENVEEIERRAVLAVNLLTDFEGRLARFAAHALLELPDDHPLRDIERILGVAPPARADRAAEGDREASSGCARTS
jgi:hypothetical protein